MIELVKNKAIKNVNKKKNAYETITITPKTKLTTQSYDDAKNVLSQEKFWPFPIGKRP